MQWQPIETAPKGGGADRVTDPEWVEPPKILLAFDGGEHCVCSWDWYYAEDGFGFRGPSAWVEPVSGDLVAEHYGEPTHWAQIVPLKSE